MSSQRTGSPKINVNDRLLDEYRPGSVVYRAGALTRIQVCTAWQQVLESGLSRSALTQFHARHKYLLMAHNPVQYKALGQRLGALHHSDPAELGPRYFRALMNALKKDATRGTHANVLQHLGGYFKQCISREDRQRLHQAIEQYRQGRAPFLLPMALLKYHLRHHPDPYVAQQVYLQPHPGNLPPQRTI